MSKLITPATERLLSPLKIPKDVRIKLEYRESGKVHKVPQYVMDIWSKGEGRGYLSMEVYKFMKRIPETQIINNRVQDVEQWMIGATELTAWIIDTVFPADQLFFADEYTEGHYKYMITRLNANMLNAENVAAYKDGRREPKGLENGEQNRCKGHNWELQLHQRVGYANLLRSEGYGLHFKQGVGKTPPSVVFIDRIGEHIREKDNRAARVLIITPKNVRYNWQGELDHFSSHPIRSTVIGGDKLLRLKQYAKFIRPGEEIATCGIISYDTIPHDWDFISTVPWDLVITDESHYYKNPDSRRWKYIQMLRDNATRRIALTGTPYANHAGDLWTQLEFLGQGLSGFAKYENFRKFYVAVQQDNSGNERIVGTQNIPFIQETLARTTMYVTKEEALPDLPDKVYAIVDVEMTKPQAELYSKLASQMMVEIESMMEKSDSNSITTDHILTKMLRLAQITSGYVCYDPVINPDTGEVISEGKIEYLIPNTKIRKLLEYCKAEMEPNDKALIWTNWVASIKQLAAAIESVYGPESYVTFYGDTSDKDRKLAEQRYNEDPNCKFFIGNPAAGGTGLNLLGYKPHHPDDYDTNTAFEFYYSQNWSSIYREQSEDRCHRHGTRKQLRVVDLCVGNTIDMLIREAVTEKRLHGAELLNVNAVVSKLGEMISMGVEHE